jgi:hypothetical protein
MNRISWLTLTAAGLLVAGGMLVVLRRPPVSESAYAEAPTGKSARSASAGGESGSSFAPWKKRNRSPDAPADVMAAVSETIAELERVKAEDFADRLDKIVAGWRSEDLPGAVDALFEKNFSEDASVALKYGLLRRWASLSPMAAAAWAERLPAGQSRADAMEQVALAWTASDSDAAWQWAESLPQDDARDAVMISLAYETSRENPELSVDRAEEIPESQGKSRLVEHAFGVWAASDPQAAMRRVEEISDPALRDASLGALAVSWAESDPLAAATKAADAMQPGAAQERTVSAIVQRWAQQDPAAVRHWVDAFPDGPLKRRALELIAEQTAPKTPVTPPAAR